MGHILIKNIGINRTIGSIILATICFIVFTLGIEKITKINTIIIPVLIIFIVSIGIYNLKYIEIQQIGDNIIVKQGFSWIIQSILYASYNTVLVMPFLISLKSLLKNRKQLVIISINTSIIIIITAFFMFLLLVNVNTDFTNLDMPTVYVIKKCYIEISKLYSLIVLSAIFTTAISIGIGFLNNIGKNNNKSCNNNYYYRILTLIMCFISVIISKFGFAKLVRILFPMLGYFGIVQILLILLYSDKK